MKLKKYRLNGFVFKLFYLDVSCITELAVDGSGMEAGAIDPVRPGILEGMGDRVSGSYDSGSGCETFHAELFQLADDGCPNVGE